ncbi:MAG: type II toxin-antitoxin system Phd/YefM family antitoxin [Corynebacterium sp.]|nr:type II toxin-antitoxin system Phd/YefM family antitoxin [Corynebacterium sp.]
MTTSIPLAKLRGHLGEYINRSHHGKDRITITRNGKPTAAIIPFEDLELLEAIEDELDAAALKRAKQDDDGYRISLRDLLNETD